MIDDWNKVHHYALAYASAQSSLGLSMENTDIIEWLHLALEKTNQVQLEHTEYYKWFKHKLLEQEFNKHAKASKFVCNTCKKMSPDLKRCTRCTCVLYCSPECQVLA